MKNEMNEMQLMMSEMVKWFHSFCQRNDIRYYMVGGTMLGAVRHNGFIPWDDDIDVGIPRKDYERLLKNKNQWLYSEKKYYIESYLDNNKDFEFRYAKVYDTQTTLIENCRSRTKRGIFIDVFPLDGIGDNKEEALNNYSSIQKYVQFLLTRTCKVKKSRTLTKNLVIIASRLIPNFIIDNKKIISKINTLCSVRDFDTSMFVGNLVGMWGAKEIMPREFFGKPTLYKFEDTELYGPEKYDDYLKNLYNNWRQLPPLEKQKSDHNFLFLDLHKPYSK